MNHKSRPKSQKSHLVLDTTGGINPNLTTCFTGLVGKVRKKLSHEGGIKEGRVEKKARAVRPPGRGLEPGTCRVLGEGPQLHAMGAV